MESTVNCDRYRLVVANARRLVSGLHRAVAQNHLLSYLTSYRGRLFNAGAPSPANSFTAGNLAQVEHLSVRCSLAFQRWLLGSAGQKQTGALLEKIDPDLDIADVEPCDYDRVLGPGSPSWELWTLLYGKLSQHQVSPRDGTIVTAGKLLHGKRPKLIPIYDSRIRSALGVSNRNLWEAFWCVMRDAEVRKALLSLQASFPQAGHLSPLRVLDIIAWMS